MKIEDLKAKLLDARKARDSRKVEILSTVLGNLTSNAKLVDGVKTVSEDEVMVYLKKHIKGLEESISYLATKEAREELEYLQGFLPKQLTREELEQICEAAGMKGNVGSFMKLLKEKFPSQYDGKLASEVAKQ